MRSREKTEEMKKVREKTAKKRNKDEDEEEHEEEQGQVRQDTLEQYWVYWEN